MFAAGYAVGYSRALNMAKKDLNEIKNAKPYD